MKNSVALKMLSFNYVLALIKFSVKLTVVTPMEQLKSGWWFGKAMVEKGPKALKPIWEEMQAGILIGTYTDLNAYFASPFAQNAFLAGRKVRKEGEEMLQEVCKNLDRNPEEVRAEIIRVALRNN